MAATRAQTKVTASSASATSLSLSYGSAPTPGNLQTLVTTGNGNDPAPPAPDNTWLSASISTGSGQNAGVYYRAVPAGAPTGPYVVSQPSLGEIAAVLDEWTGFPFGNYVLVSHAENHLGGVATISVNLGSSGNDVELVLAVVAVGGSNATAPTASGGLTQDTGFLNFSLDLAIATPTTATSFPAATISWTTAHSTDMAAAIIGSTPAVFPSPIPPEIILAQYGLLPLVYGPVVGSTPTIPTSPGSAFGFIGSTARAAASISSLGSAFGFQGLTARASATNAPPVITPPQMPAEWILSLFVEQFKALPLVQNGAATSFQGLMGTAAASIAAAGGARTFQGLIGTAGGQQFSVPPPVLSVLPVEMFLAMFGFEGILLVKPSPAPTSAGGLSWGVRVR